MIKLKYICKISVKEIPDVFNDITLLSRLKKLTFKNDSQLREEILYTKEKLNNGLKVEGKVIIASIKNIIIGWGLLIENGDRSYSFRNNFFMLYVRKIFRRKGIGTALLNKAKEVANSSFIIFPHDKKSNSFFYKNFDIEKMLTVSSYPLTEITN